MGRGIDTEGNVQLALRDPIWHSGDSNTERLILYDERGIFEGRKRQVYVVSTQNVAFFSNDFLQILDAIENRRLKYV